MTGIQHLQGQTGNAFVHVGAVDAPVTFDEVMAAVAECAASKAGELHVLGWEWEMGLNDLVSDEAKKQGVKVVLRQIPREVMEAEAAARATSGSSSSRTSRPRSSRRRLLVTVRVELENFVIPNPELVPDDVREKITKWSDYVDYWAVDWGFQRRHVHARSGYVPDAPRSNARARLGVAHIRRAGEYRVMIKVIDVFGNDTSKLVTISVA